MTTHRMISRRQRVAAATSCDRADRQPLEEARPSRGAGEDHHPGQQEDDVEVDGREGLLLVDDPATTITAAAEQRRQGPVDPLGRDQRIGDEEDERGQRDRLVHDRLGPDCR